MEQATEFELRNRDGLRTAMNIIFCSFVGIFSISFDYSLLAVVIPYMIVLYHAGLVIKNRSITKMMKRCNIISEILTVLILVNMGIKHHLIWTLMIPFILITLQSDYLTGKRKKDEQEATRSE